MPPAMSRPAPSLPAASCIQQAERRRLLAAASALAALAWAGSARAAVTPKNLAHDGAALESALRAIRELPPAGAELMLDLPEVADDGGLVPVTVRCTLPQVRELALVVEGNPVPMVAVFSLPEGTEPQISTRIRLAQSTRVHAIALAGERRCVASRAVGVVTGGCA